MANAAGSHKKLKFEHSLLNDINVIIRSQLSDVRLTLVSITKVELSRDYSYADVFWDTFQSEAKDEAARAFESVTGKVRSLLAAKLNIRHVPEIRFVYDSQFEEEKKIEQLLSEISTPSGDSSEED